MLPPFIIEQIRQREERERRIAPQPYLELPIPYVHPNDPREEQNEPNRGVVIIDLLGG